MGSTTFAAVTKSLIPLNSSPSIVALQLNHSEAQELPHGQCIDSLGPSSSTAGCTSLLSLPYIPDFQPEMGMFAQAQAGGAGCRG